MKSLSEVLQSLSAKPIPILDADIPLDKYVPIDLSSSNSDISDIDITDPSVCQVYIDNVLKAKGGQVAYGGYLEKRNLYDNKLGFSESGASPRNIHLGMDFWAPTGTAVLAPLAGKVHSFRNNATVGDYGPTIILEHQVEGGIFYTLYGHLSLESLDKSFLGQELRAGETVGTLGAPDINVNYAPHLHFQLIQDMEGKKGDYPGVSTLEMLDFYTKNCPNPNLLLKI